MRKSRGRGKGVWKGEGERGEKEWKDHYKVNHSGNPAPAPQLQPHHVWDSLVAMRMSCPGQSTKETCLTSL